MSDAWSPPTDGGSPAPTAGYLPLTVATRALHVQQLLMVLFRIGTVTSVLALGVLAPEVLDGSDAPIDDPAVATLTVGMLLAFVGLILTALGGLPVWGFWHWRAAKNLEALGHINVFSPVAQVGWWFVPFANLVMPYRAMEELVVASRGDRYDPDPALNDSDTAPTSTSMMPLWWGCWLGGNIVSNLSGRMESLGTAALLIDGVAGMILLAASWMYLQLARQVDAAQAARVK